MKHKLKASILLLIFSLGIISQAAQAATYYVDSAKDEIIQFNRAMATNDRKITLDYNTEENDYVFKVYERQYALQDYADSDYAYYNLNRIRYSTLQGNVDGKDKLTVDYSIEGLETPDQTEYVYDTIHKLIKDNPTLIKASNYEKAAWAYDYVVSHVTYDYSYSNYSAYGALHGGTAVCQGFSLLYYALATELGLECKIVSGEADNGETIGSHAWNLIMLGGEWYCVDTTWGACTNDKKYFLALKKDLTTHMLDPIYENYFNFATTAYNDEFVSEYHGMLASVYNVKFDPLKLIDLSSENAFQWMLSNPDQIDLTFTTMDTNIATVSQDGMIQAVGSGTTVIKALNQDLGIQQVCEVTVNTPEPKLTGFDSVKVDYNKTASISLKVSPSNASLKNVTYISKNNSIATVNSQGVVTGKRVGSTTVMVTYGDNQKVEIPITVSPAVNSKYKSVTVSVKKTYSIKYAVSISDKGYRDLIYKTTDSKIAKVSTSGTVTGVKKGSCYIKIYDKAGSKLVAKVKVLVK